MNAVENEPASTTRAVAGFGAVMRREFKRIFGRKRYWLLVCVLPLVSFGLAWGLFSNPYPHDLPVAVVDLDHSALSRKVTAFIDATSSIAVVSQLTDLAAAKDLLLCGRVYAVVFMPQGMEKDIKRGQGAVIVGYYNAQVMLPGSIIASTLNTVAATASAGINYQSRLRRGQSGAEARIHLEPVELDRHVLANPQLNYLYFLAAALCPALLQLFVVMSTVVSMGEELKEGTADKWFATAGGNIRRAVYGKLGAYLPAFGLAGALMLVMIIRGFGMPLRGSPAALVGATFLLVLASQACGLMIVVVSPSLRMALSIASFYAGTAFAFVGLTFPYGGMPAVGKAWANLLPLTHYLRFFHAQTLGGARFAVCPDLALMGVFVLLGLLAIPLLKQLLVDERYWGWL